MFIICCVYPIKESRTWKATISKWLNNFLQSFSYYIIMFQMGRLCKLKYKFTNPRIFFWGVGGVFDFNRTFDTHSEHVSKYVHIKLMYCNILVYLIPSSKYAYRLVYFSPLLRNLSGLPWFVCLFSVYAHRTGSKEKYTFRYTR